MMGAKKPFVLQRKADGGRDHWFDAEAFETREQALARLSYRRREAQARIDSWGGSGYTGERPQRMRVVQLVDDMAALTRARGAACHGVDPEPAAPGEQSS